MADTTQSDPTQVARKVELIVAQMDSLPTLPRIATQLLRLTRCDQVSTRQVIELIKQDQALTAKILSLARRAGSGIRGEASTIDKCVLLMGLEAVRNAALSIKIFEVFNPSGGAQGGDFDLSGFWKHSLAVGLAAEKLGELLPRSAPGGTRRPGPEELFVAGLLHDIGKPALHHALPKSYGKVIEAAEAGHAPLQVLERHMIGVDHAVIGKRLAQRWNLPEGVIDAIWLHHSPPSALPDSVRSRGFAAVAHLADLIVRELRLGYSGNHPRPVASARLAAEMGIGDDDLEKLRRSLPDELAARSSLIGIDSLDSRDLYYEALTDANNELARLNARLIARGRTLASKARYLDLLGELGRRVRPDGRPMEVAETIAHLLLPLTAAARMVVFSEPPASNPSGGDDPMLEGVAVDADRPDEPERFLFQPDSGDIEGLSAARRAGWFDPSQSSDGFSLFPLEGHLSWVHHRLANPLPQHGCYLLPLLAEGVWVGAAVFAASDADGMPAGWPACRLELLAVASAAGAALRTAQVVASAEQTAEELARSAEHCARLQDELSRQRALASVGQMAAGAGHELNNPLTVISGRSELLAAGEADPKRREALEQIRQNAQRASAIITEMMSFARPPAARPQRIDLPDLLRRMAGPLAHSGIDVSIEAPAELPAVWADPAQLQEALQEVLDNAQQAMAAQDADRRLIVRVAEPPLPAAAALHRPDGRELEVVIIDTGVGMAPEVLEHATDPFFSARPAGRGRGLGLARAHRLIEHNGGRLRLESQPGVGTTARVTVPVAPDPPPAEATP